MEETFEHKQNDAANMEMEQEQEQEPSLSGAFQNLLLNEALHDVVLEGTDGVRVSANRGVLAARSTVFEKMLFGPFQESNQKTVTISNFEGQVLRAIVEYIHTDSCKILEEGTFAKEKGAAVTPIDIETLEKVVSSAGAATYFSLLGLRTKITQKIEELLLKTPSYAFILIESMHTCAWDVEDIKKLAQSNIRSNVGKAVDPCAIAHLSPPVLEEILKDNEIERDECQLFEILQIWVESRNNAPDEADAGSSRNPKSNNWKAIATEMAKHIHLEWIDTIMLSTTVASSGLFTQEQLANAYQLQAIAAQKEHNFSFNRPRLIRPVWRRSQSKIAKSTGQGEEGTDLIDHPPIVSGMYSWTVEIERQSVDFHVDLGVALIVPGEDIDYDDWLGSYSHSWFISGNLRRFNGGHEDGDDDGDEFGGGDRVALMLDLLPDDESNGTLSFCVNDGESFEIFDNLLDELDGERGFVPAVSFGKKCVVRLLDFEQLA